MYKPKVLLVVMDGWGYSQVHKGNAIWSAKTPTFDYLWKNYLHTTLNAFGESVGLPWGSIGSSEVGHTSIGTGRLINQEISRIDKEIDDGNFINNEIIISFIKKIQDKGKNIHIIGLVSDGGVHSRIDHLFSLLTLLKRHNFTNNIYIHVITDGRDTSPNSALEYLSKLEKVIKKLKVNAKIASILGRYYAMDRDSRWERTKKAYDTITANQGEVFNSYKEAIDSSYENKISDEFIIPCLINLKESSTKSFLGKIFSSKKEERDSEAFGTVKPDDGVIFFNTRSDRMRQIVEMFLFPKNEIGTNPLPKIDVVTLSTYDKFLPVKVAYPTEPIENPIAKIISDHGYSQGHFAETEKYAHVTYFFNGGNPTPFKNEEWFLVPSPKVKTYDLKPEMSAIEITDKFFEEINKKCLDFVLINYANCDMVGHTGAFKQIVNAVEVVDNQLKRLIALLPETTLFITADHGNAESKIHPKTEQIDKRHTVNPVPLIIAGEKYKIEPSEEDSYIYPTGILADIAPAILSVLGIKKTPKMNGVNIIDNLDFTKPKTKESAK